MVCPSWPSLSHLYRVTAEVSRSPAAIRFLIEVDSGCSPAIRVKEATLFPFDDYSIPITWGLRRQLVMGKRFGRPNPVVVHLGGPGDPDNIKIQYYGTVIQMGDELRMWYLGQGDKATFDPPGLLPMYAVSKDGVHWEKPKLGLVTYDGNKQNNLIDLCRGELGSRSTWLFTIPKTPTPGGASSVCSKAANIGPCWQWPTASMD